MGLRKVTTTSVEVYKVKGETMKIAFNNLKQEHSFDNHHLEVENREELTLKNISNGAIYKRAKQLHYEYINNTLSEYTIKGALYNVKPKLKDSSRIVMHNIVNKGTKQWETVNRFVTDGGIVIEDTTTTKDIAVNRAKEIALERNETINLLVSKRLVDMDGILAIAEFIPFDCIDDTNIYVFWVFTTDIKSVEEEDLIDEHLNKADSAGQLSLKEDLYSYQHRAIVT